MSLVAGFIFDAVVDELGILRPNGYVGSHDIQSRQLVALFNQVGDYILNQHDWQALIKLAVFNTSPGTNTYGVPGDWVAFIDQTMWNQSARVQVGGPRNQDDWAAYETFHWGMTLGPYFVQQMLGNRIHLQPDPSGYDTITYYYLSGSWVQSASGYTDRLTSDLDKVVWRDDRMMISGLKAAWLRAKRLSYDEEADLFQKQIRANIAIDRGAQDLSMDPARQCTAPSTGIFVPAGNWGD